MIESMQDRFDAKRLNVHWTKSGPRTGCLLGSIPNEPSRSFPTLINAAKFTDPGGWIKIHLDERDPQVVELSVLSDLGTGMDAELLATMFVPFQPEEDCIGQARPGTRPPR